MYVSVQKSVLIGIGCGKEWQIGLVNHQSKLIVALQYNSSF